MRTLVFRLMAAVFMIFPGIDAVAADRVAADRPVLVELFTSQGCSSCPTADAFLHELAAREDVIALALHVDYWDYIFDDIFGKAAHTERQYGYAATGGRDMVYTPQMVINGEHDVVGNRAQDVNALIEKHLAAPGAVALTLTRDADQMLVSAVADDGLDVPLIVLLARYIPQQTVSIDHGENAGQTYSYINIVTDLTELARWDPAQPFEMKVSAPPDSALAVIVQRPGYGKVEAAALLR